MLCLMGMICDPGKRLDKLSRFGNNYLKQSHLITLFSPIQNKNKAGLGDILQV